MQGTKVPLRPLLSVETTFVNYLNNLVNIIGLKDGSQGAQPGSPTPPSLNLYSIFVKNPHCLREGGAGETVGFPAGKGARGKP